jgi:hypothetical protein
MRTDWIEMSKSDEHRLVAKELAVLKAAKAKNRTERLAQIEEEKDRPRGSYTTDVERWTCTCPSYLISLLWILSKFTYTVNWRAFGEYSGTAPVL